LGQWKYRNLHNGVDTLYLTALIRTIVMQSSFNPPENKDDITLAYSLLQSSIESLKDTLIFSIDRDYRYLMFNNSFKDATAYAYGTLVAAGVSMLETITDDKERAKAKQNCDRALQGESHTTVEVGYENRGHR
jgi:hypothetical protein